MMHVQNDGLLIESIYLFNMYVLFPKTGHVMIL